MNGIGITPYDVIRSDVIGEIEKEECDLQQENTKLKEQIDELIKWLEEEKILEEEHLKGARYPSNNYNNCVKRICEITVVLSKLKGSDIK